MKYMLDTIEEVVEMRIDGLNVKNIAHYLGVSESMVRYYTDIGRREYLSSYKNKKGYKIDRKSYKECVDCGQRCSEIRPRCKSCFELFFKAKFGYLVRYKYE